MKDINFPLEGLFYLSVYSVNWKEKSENNTQKMGFFEWRP